MGQITSNSNANFVAMLLNGFVGVIPTFANLVIKGKMKGTMFLERNEVNYPNVQAQQNVL
jgi:hypothetical protein